MIHSLNLWKEVNIINGCGNNKKMKLIKYYKSMI